MAIRVLTALAGATNGGAEAFFVSLTVALRRAGLPVRAALKHNASRARMLTDATIPYDLAPFAGVLDLRTRAVLQRVTRHFRPDIVLSFAGRASAAIPRGPYVRVGRLGGYYNLRNFRHCDYLVCNAPDLVRYVVDGGWREDRVFLIPNFPNVEEGAAVDRASLGTPEGVPVALALGRLHPNKALDILIQAASEIPDLWVWIAGEGDERANLEALAREKGVGNRVKFLGWREDRAALFRAADLCVYPLRQEPFGNVVVEAWGYGTPLVTTASTGPAWLVRNGEDAILTPVDDAPALAAGIRAVLGSPPLADRLQSNGLVRVAEEFSQDAIVSRYLKLFETIRPQGAAG